MKKITTNAESVRVVGNLIPDFDEVTSANYFIYRNVTHTQNGTVRHLGDDRLVRKVIASKISTTLYLEAGVPDETGECSFYAELRANDDSWLPEHLVVRLTYEDDTSIGLITLEPTGGEENHYSAGGDFFTIQGSGYITIKAKFEGYGHYSASETSTTIHIEPPMNHVGNNTANPWTTSMLYKGGVDVGRVWINYTNVPTILKGIPLTGDFKLILHCGIDVANATQTFGLSSAPESLIPVLTIHNTDVQGTSVSNIFPVRNQVEDVEISRHGYFYTVKHGSDVVEKYINNTGAVYLFVNKSGNGSAVLNSMDYLTE